MYTRLNIYSPARGGYLVQDSPINTGSYSEIVAAFSTKSELLKWLDINLTSRSPVLTGEEAVEDAPRQTASDDEIPF